MELGIRFCMVVIQNQEEEAYDKGRNRNEWESVKGFSFRQHSGWWVGIHSVHGNANVIHSDKFPTSR